MSKNTHIRIKGRVAAVLRALTTPTVLQLQCGICPITGPIRSASGSVPQRLTAGLLAPLPARTGRQYTLVCWYQTIMGRAPLTSLSNVQPRKPPPLATAPDQWFGTGD